MVPYNEPSVVRWATNALTNATRRVAAMEAGDASPGVMRWAIRIAPCGGVLGGELLSGGSSPSGAPSLITACAAAMAACRAALPVTCSHAHVFQGGGGGGQLYFRFLPYT